MATVIKNLPAFIGGVSQQAPALRLDTQCDAMTNFHATVADGLLQRPNTEISNMIGTISDADSPKVHFINRDADEKYMVVVTDNATTPLRIFNLDGTECVVRYGHLDENLAFTEDLTMRNYITSGVTNPRKDIKLCSIADYTILANTKQTVQAMANNSDPVTDQAHVWVKRRHKGIHRIEVRWQEASAWNSYTVTYETVDASHIDTSWLASLFDYLWTNSGATADIDCTYQGSVLTFTHLQNKDPFTLTCRPTDPYGGDDLIAISHGEVNSIDDLPARDMPDGIVIKVKGDSDTGQDDYYMQYSNENHVWSETVGHGTAQDLDAGSMPRRIVRTAANEFTVADCIWDSRTVGDDDTNPVPSFVGDTIKNISFHKRRLWFMSKDNIIGSRAGDYFNFFKTTVLEILDDDPIDLAAASEQVNIIRSGKPFEKGFIMFCDEAQFALTSGDQVFSPKSVAADPTTAYTIDPQCDPVKMGADIYFPCTKSQYLTIRQYTIVPDSVRHDAYNVTAHIPSYIPKGDDHLLAGCNLLDQMFLWSDADPTALYVHQFMWSRQEKVQQAWYRWVYSDEIRGMFVDGAVLYILFYDSTNGFRLERSELENIPYGTEPFRYSIDQMMEVSGGSYSDPDTTFTLDMDVGDGSGWTVIDGSDQSELSANFSLSGTNLTIQNADVSGNTYFVGREYECRFRLSEWYMKDAQGKAQIAGKIQLRDLTLSFKDTGYFVVETTPFNRATLAETFSDSMPGIRVGESVIGSISLLTGEKTFRTPAESKGTVVEIVTDSYLPCQIQMGSWRGNFEMKGQSV